ncbi:MAG: hypothetical protein AAGA56_26960 [Myxococcota bacterium]
MMFAPRSPLLRSLGLGLLLTASISATACSGEEAVPAVAEDITQRENISAELEDLKLYVRRRVNWEVRNGSSVLVIRGSANRNLRSLDTWVPDDAFGRVEQLTPRSFEIVLRAHEANTLLSGMSLFLDVVTETGDPAGYAGRLDLGPEFYAYRGDDELWLRQDIRPIYVRDETNPLRYQGKLFTRRDASDAFGFTDDDSDPTMTRLDARTWTFDWTYDGLALASDIPTDPVYFHADFTDGTEADKRAGILILAQNLELTLQDPRDEWPSGECDDSVKTCLEALPGSQFDLGSCGGYREVSACIREVNTCNGPLLESTPSSVAFGDEISDYNNDCGGVGDWCEVRSVETYQVPSCAPPSTRIADVVGFFETEARDWQGFGREMTRGQLENTPLFGSSYSTGGPALLQAADALAGTTQVIGYYSTSEVPCPNCSEFSDQAVLYYPATGTVVFVRGTHGFDS